MHDYMTAKDAAKEIGIEYSTLLARIRKGKVKGKKYGWAMFVSKKVVKKEKQAELKKRQESNS